MRDVVRAGFYDFNKPFEGAVNHLYQDLLGLVSIGVGILADPMERALVLPLLKADGTRASRAEIIIEWRRIKDLPDSNGKKAALLGHRYAALYTTLHLSEEGLRSTHDNKAMEMDGILRGRFPDWDQWCADAQLATMSMSWACGPMFQFPKLVHALNAKDYRAAALECHIRTDPAPDQPFGNPGVIPRNKANKLLYTNAALIAEGGLDPDVLAWPLAIADRIATPPEMAAVRPDQLEEEPCIVHPLTYPGYLPEDDEDDEDPGDPPPSAA